MHYNIEGVKHERQTKRQIRETDKKKAGTRKQVKKNKEEDKGEIAMKNIIYTIITGMIILLSKLRDRIFQHGTVKDSLHFRWDRTVPVHYEDQGSSLYMKCCDCGLEHLICYSRSVTPVRPLMYNYRLRFGSVAWGESDRELGQDAYEIAKRRGLCN